MSDDRTNEKTNAVSYGLKVTPEIKELIEDLRKSNAANKAVVFTVDDRYNLAVEENEDDCEPEDVGELLPLTEPRFVLYSYKWTRDDGRVQFPLILIYYKPRESHSPTMNLVYSSSMNSIMETCNVAGKVFDVNLADEITDDWLQKKLERCST
ncbi:Glia maturation factor beta [Carpediemonas membranifera]|uniref:Glia maturation factor beta n=1 Tax=Carpediemonas membranifera TaxID=201153 RepID=A0A8J6B9T8_9EUKA|nr:Glia maturation factor beta [Carpediemonas membranifera]|eukprot:KAG9396224.1 Glia maturation factor beta [Carpediemonas membranifera]